MDANKNTRLLWMKFWPDTWLALTRSCSPGATGVAINLLCHAHSYGEPYGYLALSEGRPIPDTKLARMANCNPRQYAVLRAELLSEGVFAQTPDGVLFCPWLVDMKQRRDLRAKSGASGGRKTARQFAQAVAQANAQGLTQANAQALAQSHCTLPLISDLSASDLSSSLAQNSELDFVSAEKVLVHLNEKIGSDFRSNPGDIYNVALCLHFARGDLAAVLQTIDRQCALWAGDARMAKYLRPMTLFDPAKFMQYFGARNQPLPAQWQPAVNTSAVNARLRHIEAELKAIGDPPPPHEAIRARRLQREREDLVEKQKTAAAQ